MQEQERKMKFRHELKYYLSYADYLVIKSRLRQIASSDSHAGPDGKYRIRSLYFETPNDKILNEKLYGVGEREKFRIRLYDNKDDFIRLEKKMKIVNATSKISCPVTRAEVEKIIAGDIDWMADSDRALLMELYTKMRYLQLSPRTIVDYDRETFIYAPGNVRVTLDTNIRTGVSSTDIFNKNLPLVRANEQVFLMEVKYDNFLPSIIKELVQLPNRRVTAFSKYAVARVFG
ncbi:MAG TPA: polyphosphate polymerase domain-containing protein [Methanocorpusculum sp.]|nr:polyphosphate polymerase domain-containing protein [Methanocorpusculum sp.]